MRFVIIDESTSVGNDSAYGGAISGSEAQQMAHALLVQLNRDLATYWGGAYAVRVGAGYTDVNPGEVVCSIMDSLPNAPGAVAYHDVAAQEVPVIFLARTQCNSILSGSSSVSCALSHELCETAGDVFCNAWRDDGQGYEWAQELCDAVQESSYDIDGVTVSNFVLPAFFAPGAPGPYDMLGNVGTALQTTPGGYQIRRTSGGGEAQVTGDIHPGRLARKRHFASRTYRRGARV